MSLSILSVAYPFAPVGPDAVGGAEQVLGALDAALVRSGHRSIVIAREDSRICGTLMPVPRHDASSAAGRTAAHMDQSRTIAAALARWPVDLVHMHGLDFAHYLPPPGVPVLATLHLPIAWYDAEALRPVRPQTWLICVSRSQYADGGANPRLCAPIENGVALERFGGAHARRGFALMLARICPEKGVHLAIDAAKGAGVPLLIGGEVFPYPDHRRYFAEQVAPRLDRTRRFIGPVTFARKRRLLAAARCLLVASLVPETSSLVAREALASGTPVIAFARGALPETVEHGRTGFLVPDVAGMAQAIERVDRLDANDCRAAARARFSAHRMSTQYMALYDAIRRRERVATAGAA